MLSNYFLPDSLLLRLCCLLDGKIPVVSGGLRPLGQHLWSKGKIQKGPLALSHWIRKANATLWFNMNGHVAVGL